MDTLDPVTDPLTLGIGQSMGGAFTIVQQGRHHGYDGVGILGYSPLRTQPPTAPGTPPLTSPLGATRHPAVRRHLHQRAGAGGGGGTGGAERRWRCHPTRNRWRGPSTSTTSTRRSCGETWRTTPPGTATSRPGDPPPSPGTAVAVVPGSRAPRWPRRPPSEHQSSSRSVSVTSWSIHAASPGHTSRRPSVDLFVCPRMAHMHNFAGTRELFWRRIETWAQWVRAVRAAQN